MIIDGHAHALAEFSTPESITEILTKLNVDKIVLCPGGGDPKGEPMRPKLLKISLMYNPRIHLFSNKFLRLVSRNIKDRDFGNELVFSLVQKLPDKIIQFYWVNLKDSNYYQKMTIAFNKWNFKGIKLHQCVVPFKLDSNEIENITKFANDNHLPIFIHLYSAKEAKKMVKLASRYPHTNFIIAHLMGFEQIMKSGPDLKNIYFDISTYYIVSNKRIKKVIKQYGIEHVFLGSDSPLGYNNLENNIKRVRNMDLLEEEKNLILGGNIARLLKLES